MESLSGSGRAGIRIRDFTSPVRELGLASGLESGSLADLAGDGDTGDTIGVVTEFSSITTATFPTAEFSSIVTTSIAPADFTEPEDFMVAERRENLAVANVDSRRLTPSPVRIPAHSAALITEGSREAFLLAGNQASAEASTGVEAVTEEAVAGNSVQCRKRN
jgi:hypothetical protein